MMRIFLIFMFFSINFATHASEKIILISPADCVLLSRHIADADVEYKPGVDVRGNDIAPADLSASNNLGLGENGYSFYMTHDALKNNPVVNGAGISGSQAGSEEGKIILGQVTVKNGDVLWNGTSLKENDRDRILLLCEENNEEKRRPIYKR